MKNGSTTAIIITLLICGTVVACTYYIASYVYKYNIEVERLVREAEMVAFENGYEKKYDDYGNLLWIKTKARVMEEVLDFAEEVHNLNTTPLPPIQSE